jgi:hypothetical protein
VPQRCLAFIRDEAPLVVHLFADAHAALPKLLRDTHYRNQFETGSSGGVLDATARCGRCSEAHGPLAPHARQQTTCVPRGPFHGISVHRRRRRGP